MDDEEIAARIRERGLEEEYVRELMASLGYDPGEGWTVNAIGALESATTEQRRAAALRCLELQG
jgi:hypothetical protein